AVEGELLLRLLGIAREIGRALPAATRAEEGALGFEGVVERGHLAWPAGGAFLDREADLVFVLIELDGLVMHIGMVGEIGEAPMVEAPEVPFRLAVDDPLRHGLARTTRLA